MRSRRLILGLILLTLVVTVLAASAKLRATPKFDRIQVGETTLRQMFFRDDVIYVEDHRTYEGDREISDWVFDCVEGRLVVSTERRVVIRAERLIGGESWIDARITEKRMTQRGPLERLAWLAERVMSSSHFW